MSKIKILLVLGLILILIIGMSGIPGCKTTTAATETTVTAETTVAAETTAAPAETTAVETVTITYLTDMISDICFNAWVDFWDKFTAANPDIKVNMERVEQSEETIRIQMAAGGGPDMCGGGGAMDVPRYASAGKWISIEDWAVELGWKDSLIDWAVKSVSYNGDLYALPWGHETTALNVNRKLLDENGWSVPTTREEFVKICDEAMAKDLIAIAYGASGLPLLHQWIYDHYINGYAGADVLVSVLKNEKRWDDPAIVGAFKLIKEDWDKGYFNDKNALAITFDEMNAEFLGGKALFDTQGTWASPQISNEQFESDVMSYESHLWPSMRDGISPTSSVACGEIIGVNANTKYPEQVKRAFDFMMKNDAAVLEAVAAGMVVPPRKLDLSMLPANASLGAKSALATLQNFSGQTDNMSYAPWTFYPSKANIYLYDNLEKVLLDKMSVEDYLANTQKEFEKDLAEGYVFPG